MRIWPLVQHHKPRNKRAGISLLEVMVTLAIIALVVGLAAPRVMETFGRAKSQAALVKLNTIKGSLQLYYLDVGRYPSETEGLQALLANPGSAEGWQGPYLDGSDDIADPWGRVFLYRIPGSDRAFDLYSYGRDGRTGGTAEDTDISL